MGEAKRGSGQKKLSFEEAFSRLEEITSRLEQGNLMLDEAVKIFEEGRLLLTHCEQLLGQAEKVLKIVNLSDGLSAAEDEEEE